MTADELYKKGIIFLKDNDRLNALSCFEKAYSLKKSPEIQSYLALCIAMERGQVKEAIKQCTEAIEQEPHNTVHYLNLGRVYLKEGRKVDAIEIFRKGLSFGDNPEIRVLLDSFKIRKKPIFYFLPRDNFFNKYMGLLLRWLRLR